MLILALAIMQPVEAQSFKPDYDAGLIAWAQKDYATALKHYRGLAKQGDAPGQNWLGLMYQNGQGVTRNYKEAVKWFRKAAKQGYGIAQRNLGRMYGDGKGVLQDLVMAYAWLNVAATNGHPFSGDDRDKVLSRLTAPERKLASKLSKLCLRQPAKCPEYSDD